MGDLLFQVFEDRREIRMAESCSVVAEIVVGIDFCKTTGGDLGSAWNCIVANEDNDILGQRACSSTSLEDLEEWLMTIGSRPGMKARVGVIDNVPPNYSTTGISKLVETIARAFNLDLVLQDRFHVSHNMTAGAVNNFDLRFWPLIIKLWRERTTVRDQAAETIVDTAFLAGKISKKVTFRGVKYQLVKGVPNDEAVLAKWKELGIYHEAFSTRPKVVVPENVAPKEALPDLVKRWTKEVKDACFDAEGKPTRSSRGTLLFNTMASLEKMAADALKRIMNCSVPSNQGFEPWSRRLGADGEPEVDHNNFPVWKPNYHTGGIESINAAQPDFVVGPSNRRERATALHYEGNAVLRMKKAVRLGRMEDVGTSDLRRAHRINHLAGFGVLAKSACSHRLVKVKPLRVEEQPTPAADEVYIRDVERFDQKAPRSLSMDVAKEPSFHPQLPPPPSSSMLTFVNRQPQLDTPPQLAAPPQPNALQPQPNVPQPQPNALLQPNALPQTDSYGAEDTLMGCPVLGPLVAEELRREVATVGMVERVDKELPKTIDNGVRPRGQLDLLSVSSSSVHLRIPSAADVEAARRAKQVRPSTHLFDLPQLPQTQISSASIPSSPAITPIITSLAPTIVSCVATVTPTLLVPPLVQSSRGVKRSYNSSRPATAEDRKIHLQNKWYCTCLPVYPACGRGNPQHDFDCQRELWRTGKCPKYPAIDTEVRCSLLAHCIPRLPQNE